MSNGYLGRFYNLCIIYNLDAKVRRLDVMYKYTLLSRPTLSQHSKPPV